MPDWQGTLANNPTEQICLLATPDLLPGLTAAAEEAARGAVCRCESMEEFCAKVEEGMGVGLLAEPVLDTASLPSLAEVLARQPPGAGTPILLVGAGRDQNELLARMIADGYLTLLDRELSPANLVSVLRLALLARRREWQLGQQMSELQRAQRELARSNDDLQQFSYIVSHDLKEPLRMVSQYTQLLQHRYGGKLDSDADDFIGYVVEGTQRLSQLINDLLSYSHASTREATHQWVNTEGVYAWTLMNLAVTIKESGAEVTRDALPEVWYDQAALIHVFQNLIGNAIKYCSGETPKIHVCAEQQARCWQFCVQDNGIGIEPQYQERIFGVFKRLHGKEVPGTGIGLAICQRIVEMNGGRIWVESALGQGSTFFFTIPLQQPDASASIQ